MPPKEYHGGTPISGATAPVSSWTAKSEMPSPFMETSKSGILRPPPRPRLLEDEAAEKRDKAKGESKPLEK